MSLHLSEPRSSRPANRMFRIWECDVIETATDAVVATAAAQKTPEQAQAAGERLITRMRDAATMAAKQREAGD